MLRPLPVVLTCLVFSLASAGHAQCPAFCTGALSAGQCGVDDTVCEGEPRDYSSGPCSGNGCGATHNCRTPTVGGPSLEVLPEAGGTYTVRLTMDVHAPWNDWAATENPNGTLDMLWFDKPSVPAQCSTGFGVSICEYLGSDHTRCFLERRGLSCGGAPYSFGTFSFRAQVCGGGCFCEQFPTSCPCWRKVDRNNLSFTVTGANLGCPVPPKDDCDDCKACKLAGPGRGNVGGGGGRGAPSDSGPGAMLRYAAGGVGHPDFPGTPAWNETLGRYWSHDYAERIVPDPDDSHVWLITKTATFREFSGLSGGVYTSVSPSDEKRKLHRTATGWELRELDGMVHELDQDGLWLRSVDRNGNAKVATYSADRLASVSFPDGRSETFAYHPDGKLASITEVGVEGAASRTWEYTWAGDDLVRVNRPDGTAWEFFYEDAAHPGYMTRMELVGTDASRRVETAWEYDARGNVVKLWRGDASFDGPGAVEKWSFSFDNPSARPSPPSPTLSAKWRPTRSGGIRSAARPASPPSPATARPAVSAPTSSSSTRTLRIPCVPPGRSTAVGRRPSSATTSTACSSHGPKPWAQRSSAPRSGRTTPRTRPCLSPWRCPPPPEAPPSGGRSIPMTARATCLSRPSREQKGGAASATRPARPTTWPGSPSPSIRPATARTIGPPSPTIPSAAA